MILASYLHRVIKKNASRESYLLTRKSELSTLATLIRDGTRVLKHVSFLNKATKATRRNVKRGNSAYQSREEGLFCLSAHFHCLLLSFFQPLRTRPMRHNVVGRCHSWMHKDNQKGGNYYIKNIKLVLRPLCDTLIPPEKA